MPSDALVLGFDTSAAHCAAALVSGARVLAQAQEEMARGQAERLMPLLQELLAQGGAAWSDLAAIGVGIGPGNFTGIRISVAAARGVALGLGVPAIGVSVFEARAHGLPRPIHVVEDARRGMVYAQAFGDKPAEPLLLDLSDIGFAADTPVVGTGAALAADQAGVPVLSSGVPLAVAIAQIAASRLGTSQPRPAPLYLRAPDAAPSNDPGPVMLS
ncbi:MAG: tRNA threonylcarbamoyl adenosine modification protein YeaZ [Roseibaca calidilacus]|uniref:tRNA threonylcarbamoyl adenosine modification protein YeaZ n=1 Tax=Roseibaca calidilacus TaxID=1666912 RepID=A0A0N8K841_9RHOB|nr:tRNA (adenosine(37)-N6)-threonylcarbamoyltransferase complex dimerization subunit type 1 TsaB [Roseibaca calidilacus]KPP93481.1 MAG: tRNA threonylcarbamoyl adenosine modification protein YeaZ [Roseibaca calidilacus]CUX80589.1 tRNA threonylcarbamoyl adenosine modification protein YeaZ [Roseibaca calidilacus]